MSLETELAPIFHLEQLMNGFNPFHDKAAQSVANGIPIFGKFLSQSGGALAPIGASMVLHPVGWGIGLAAGIVGVGVAGYFACNFTCKK